MAIPLTVCEIRDLFEYNPSTGVLLWRKRYDASHGTLVFNSRYAGNQAWWIDEQGYWKVKVPFKKKKMAAHRVIWALYYGEHIAENVEIDHINGDRSDNKIENLRLATRSENSRNANKIKTTQLPIGVTRQHGLYRARVMVDGKQKHVGYFKTPEDAGREARQARLINHGRFAVDGRPGTGEFAK